MIGRRSRHPTTIQNTAQPDSHVVSGSSASRKLAYTGLLLGKKSRLSGRIRRVAEIAQADTNQAKPLLRAEADTFQQ